MRIIGSNQKQYKCDTCETLSKSGDVAMRVPYGWLRVQKKNDRYGIERWETILMICDKCAQTFEMPKRAQ